ncbi:uncharacterized protein LOC127012659 [Gymnogyps californianus]|uniref:uncharacterized protein LOC127012659 n=1 Tax=Gymnogyps californianus TaxID=33616 RepID=UPI0021C8C40F|nr:uncharacterized protein LOC127012659 [Gymnogyps californianus]
MEKEKFQQKALKQTKQKKSKSAEFLMVKEERAATEGIENPAFNISSTDLSVYQPSEEKVIRHDKPDSTLAAHQQKLGLQAHAEPRGNEYSRNYFDPLMDEEINPRQCGMEVSEEDPVKFDEQILYGKLMKLLDEENKILDFQACVASEDFPDSVMPVSSSKARDLHRELEDEEIPSYIEQFERDVQDDIILLGSFSLEQVDCSKTPQLIEIHIKCLRGVKDKVPKGHYTLKVSVLSRLGGGLLQWPKLKEQPQARTTLPVSHDGNFYNIEIYFGQSIQTVLPPRKAVKPGMVLLFELFLLRGTHTWIDQEVIKLPQDSDKQNKCDMHFHLPPELLMYSSVAERNGVSEKVEQSGPQEDDFYRVRRSSADEHCLSFWPKEGQGGHHKISMAAANCNYKHEYSN